MLLLILRSYDRSSRSLDQESPSKKKKFQTNYASTTHLLAGKKVPSSLQTKSSDLETTVFYIPGVDVKVKNKKIKGRLRDAGLFLVPNMIKSKQIEKSRTHVHWRAEPVVDLRGASGKWSGRHCLPLSIRLI